LLMHVYNLLTARSYACFSDCCHAFSVRIPRK
jgi:hypothetical protein